MTFGKRIEVLRCKKEGTGSFAQTVWFTEKKLWANWVNVHGSEVWAAESVQAQKPATVTVRYGAYAATITEGMRIRYKGIDYEIASVDNIREENRLIEMKVKASVNG